MKVTGVLSELFSSVFAFFNPSIPSQKSKDVSPVRQSDDRYTSNEIRDLYEASFGPSSLVQARTESPISALKYSPFGMLAIAGCGSDGTSNPPYNDGGTGGKDGGVSKDAGVDSGKDGGSPVPDAGAGKDGGSTALVDKDGDGFKSDVDCDDNDPNTFPLKDHETITISKSVKICSDAYYGTRLIIKNLSGVSISAVPGAPSYSKVLLHGGGAVASSEESIVKIDNVVNSMISGIIVGAYGDAYLPFKVTNSNNNTFNNLGTMATTKGMRIETSFNNKITGFELDGSFGFGIHIIGGGGNVIDLMNSFAVPSSGAWFVFAVYSDSNNIIIQNSSIGNLSIATAPGDIGAVIKGNTISNPHMPHSLNGIELAGTGATVSGNVIQKYSQGILVGSTGKNNKIQGNTLTGNSQCIVIQPGATGTVNSGNVCN